MGKSIKLHKNVYRILIGKHLESRHLVSHEEDGKTVFTGITRKQNPRM
jgi:hypothetical protein